MYLYTYCRWDQAPESLRWLLIGLALHWTAFSRVLSTVLKLGAAIVCLCSPLSVCLCSPAMSAHTWDPAIPSASRYWLLVVFLPQKRLKLLELSCLHRAQTSPPVRGNGVEDRAT